VTSLNSSRLLVPSDLDALDLLERLCRVAIVPQVEGLFLPRDSNKQGTSQSAIVTDERGRVGVVLSAKYPGFPDVRMFLDEGLVGWSLLLKLGIDGGFALFGDQRGLRSNEIFAIQSVGPKMRRGVEMDAVKSERLIVKRRIPAPQDGQGLARCQLTRARSRASLMLPSLNMYRLGSYGHNRVHNGFTSYTPVVWI
jgi:hypothetical protein